MVRSETAKTSVRRGKGDKKTRKKEAVATALYTITPFRRTPQAVVDAFFQTEQPATTAQRPTPCHKQVFASLNGKAWTLERLRGRVRQREGRHLRARVALTNWVRRLQSPLQA